MKKPEIKYVWIRPRKIKCPHCGKKFMENDSTIEFKLKTYIIVPKKKAKK